MGQSLRAYTMKIWKVADLKRSDLNARPPFSPDDVALIRLADSIKKRGVLQAPAVRADGTIIFGSRRVFAAGMAGLKEIQCRTYPKGLTAIEEHTLRIEENLEREDLDAIAKAVELRSFVDMQPGKSKQKAAAGLLGISEAAVSRALELLTLPALWQDLVARGVANPAHTRCVAQAGKLHEVLPGELAQVYEQLSRSKSMTVRDWEEEVSRFLEERTKPVTAEGTRTILPIYANHRAELDVRQAWNGRLVAFNLDLWRRLTRDAQKQDEQVRQEEAEDDKSPLPQIATRRRIALGWFNRQILSYLQRHAAAGIKWLPMLDISLPVQAEALANSQARTDWSLDPMKSIEIIGKIKASQAATFMADYLKAACAIALKANGWFIKDWHQAVAIAATIGLDYSEKFPTDMSDQEKAEILDAYGSMPGPGRLPKGMDAKSLGIPKSQ